MTTDITQTPQYQTWKKLEAEFDLAFQRLENEPDNVALQQDFYQKVKRWSDYLFDPANGLRVSYD